MAATGNRDGRDRSCFRSQLPWLRDSRIEISFRRLAAVRSNLLIFGCDRSFPSVGRGRGRHCIASRTYAVKLPSQRLYRIPARRKLFHERTCSRGKLSRTGQRRSAVPVLTAACVTTSKPSRRLRPSTDSESLPSSAAPANPNVNPTSRQQLPGLAGRFLPGRSVLSVDAERVVYRDNCE